MKKFGLFSQKLILSIIFFLLPFFSYAAWNWETYVNNGDTLNGEKWNALVDQIKVASNFEGFSYYGMNVPIAATWQSAVFGQLEYDSFPIGSYNSTTGIFTAPRNGFYRFTLHGWTSASTNNNDRYGLGINVNNSLKKFGGGNYSTADSPIGSFTSTIKLSQGDIVSPAIYSSITTVYGHPTHGATFGFYFQGEFVGK